jgi:glucose-6-phosphate 1-dehydrogenase
MRLERPVPQALVIFGASGDLTRRKILPALYNLFYDNCLPERFALVGFARSGWDDDTFRKHARASVEEFSRRENSSPESRACLRNVSSSHPLRAYPTTANRSGRQSS